LTLLRRHRPKEGRQDGCCCSLGWWVAWYVCVDVNRKITRRERHDDRRSGTLGHSSRADLLVRGGRDVRSLSQEKVGGIVSIKELKLVVLYLQKCANLDSVPPWGTRWWYCIDQIVQSRYCIYGSVGTSIRFLVGETLQVRRHILLSRQEMSAISDGSEGSLRPQPTFESIWFLRR
jgi:hypothetical protein